MTEKILNHNPKALSGVAGIYNRHEYLPERKAALEAWGQRIVELVAMDREVAFKLQMRK